MPRYIAFCLFLFCSTWASGQIRLPNVLSSNMVLQRNATVQLWGWASPGEKIKVFIPWSNTTDSVVTTRDATWNLSVKTPAAGGPYTITLQSRNIIRLENVLIGEVWVCSGQSNMEWSGNHGLKDIKAELPVCADANIRFFQIPKTTAAYPQDDCPAKWTACDSTTLKSFSAVGYFFGRQLKKELNVPIGLINTSWGGTPAEVWTPAPEVENDPVLKEAATKLSPSSGWPHTPGNTYNAMIAPLTRFRIAGAIWYQGESNTGTAGTYTKLLTTMIGSWRKTWQQDFPFYLVQIAPFRYGPGTLKGALLREAQTAVLTYPRTGMTVITDLVDDTTNIHPQNKHDVGARLANLALADTYGKQGIIYRYPLYEKMEKQAGRIIVYFSHAEDGLKIRGDKATAFFIAGADRQFVPADVKVDGNKVIVSAKGVKQPEAVRFGFGNSEIGNLFSKSGLPAGPFRTDHWEEQ